MADDELWPTQPQNLHASVTVRSLIRVRDLLLERTMVFLRANASWSGPYNRQLLAIMIALVGLPSLLSALAGCIVLSRFVLRCLALPEMKTSYVSRAMLLSLSKLVTLFVSLSGA